MPEAELEEFTPADKIPRVRKVDAIALSIVRTARVVRPDIVITDEMAKDIAVSAHIDARYRRIDLEALDTAGRAPVPSEGTQAPPDEEWTSPEGWDYASMEDQTPGQTKLYNMCIDKIEGYLVQIGTPMGDATKQVFQFLEGMHVDKYSKPFPRTQMELKRGPMSYLIQMMKDNYTKAIRAPKE